MWLKVMNLMKCIKIKLIINFDLNFNLDVNSH